MPVSVNDFRRVDGQYARRVGRYIPQKVQQQRINALARARESSTPQRFNSIATLYTLAILLPLLQRAEGTPAVRLHDFSNRPPTGNSKTPQAKAMIASELRAAATQQIAPLPGSDAMPHIFQLHRRYRRNVSLNATGSLHVKAPSQSEQSSPDKPRFGSDSRVMMQNALSAAHFNRHVIKDTRNNLYLIYDPAAKIAVIKAINDYFTVAGQPPAISGQNPVELMAALTDGYPIVVAPISISADKSNRHKRVSKNERDQIINDHISQNCDFEAEILTLQGENAGKALIFKAQRAENPFRMIYDNTEGAPSPAQRGVANGFNIVADIVTLGLKPLLGTIIAHSYRRSYYQSLGDGICAERFKQLTLAEIAMAVDVDSMSFKSRGIKKLKPTELRHALPHQDNAAWYIRNPVTAVRKEVLLEVHHGHGKLKHPGNTIYLKPTAEENIFLTYHPNAQEPKFLERKVVVDEQTMEWRYADDFDASALNVRIEQGKKSALLYGEYHELNMISDKKYEIVVYSESGSKAYLPVYMEPLSKTWHLATQNKKTVFKHRQSIILERLSVDPGSQKHYQSERITARNYYEGALVYRAKLPADTSPNTFGRYIEINGKLVPLREIQNRKSGNSYEIYDIKDPSKRGYAVMFDGDRWVFEGRSAFQVSAELEKTIPPILYGTKVNRNQLYAPDSQGLTRDAQQNLYLRINKDFHRVHQDANGELFISGKVNKLYLSYQDGFYYLKKNGLNHKQLLVERRINKIIKQQRQYRLQGDHYHCLRKLTRLYKQTRVNPAITSYVLEQTLIHFMAPGKRHVLLAASTAKIQETWLQKIILPLNNSPGIDAHKIIRLKQDLDLILRKSVSCQSGINEYPVLTQIYQAIDSLSTTPLTKYEGNHILNYGKPLGSKDPGIAVFGNQRFTKEVQHALDEIRFTPSGKELILAVEEIGIEIRPPVMSQVNRQAGTELFASNSASQKSIAFDPSNTLLGAGNSASLELHPWRKRPAEVGLFHEMLHIYYQKHPQLFTSSSGAMPKKVGGGSTLIEEARIVGTRYYDEANRALYDFSDINYLTKIMLNFSLKINSDKNML